MRGKFFNQVNIESEKERGRFMGSVANLSRGIGSLPASVVIFSFSVEEFNGR